MKTQGVMKTSICFWHQRSIFLPGLNSIRKKLNVCDMFTFKFWMGFGHFSIQTGIKPFSTFTIVNNDHSKPFRLSQNQWKTGKTIQNQLTPFKVECALDTSWMEFNPGWERWGTGRVRKGPKITWEVKTQMYCLTILNYASKQNRKY